MKSKNKVLFFAIAVLIILSSSTCKDALKTPTYIGTENTKLENIGVQNTAIATNIKYYNPNNFGISIKETELKIFIEGDYMADAEQIMPTDVAKNSNFSFPVIAKFNPLKMLGKAMLFMSKKPIHYKIVGTAKIGKGAFFIKVPVNIEDVYNFQ